MYDPAANTWTAVAALHAARYVHTATLLPSGKVLVAGGWSDSSALAGAEVYDPGLDFSDAWRPVVNPPAASLVLGSPLALSGSGLCGYQYNEASSGGTNSSPTNYPLVQLRRLDNGQVLWLSPSAFGATAYTSLPVMGISPGPALVTVFVNSIPSWSQPANVVLGATTTSLIASLNPSTYGQNVTFTAAVSSEGATPAGTVTFKDGATTLGVGTFSGGVATYSTAALALGSHSITAEYGGDGNFAVSLSTALVQKVERYLFLPVVLR